MNNLKLDVLLNRFQKSPEVTESKVLKYSYPLGLGAFLMSSCYRYTGTSTDYSYDANAQQQQQIYERRKRQNSDVPVNVKTTMTTTTTTTSSDSESEKSICKRYAKPETPIPCQVYCFAKWNYLIQK